MKPPNHPWLSLALAAVGTLAATFPATGQGLPPVPVPPENPITEAKRILGKILFWDEQLSSDGTIACGTCHIPAKAGGDPRLSRHPGFDGLFNTEDDVFGSAGLARHDVNGNPIDDPQFGFDPRVTRRNAQPFITSQYAPDNFWDGRAPSEFRDPITDEVLIPTGGGLESQAVGPILNDVEMAFEGRTWDDVINKLTWAAPLALATNLPPDMAAAVTSDPSYGDLFAGAFGDPAITPARIAFAIATYERTLYPDQTPWDLFEAGDPNALTAEQQSGLAIFETGGCSDCHTPPFFSDHSFRNIGLRPIEEDTGRQEVTGLPEDAGRFKMPSLRNVGIKFLFMHTGRITSLNRVVNFYVTPEDQFPTNQDSLLPLTIPAEDHPDLLAFVTDGLTDPRVEMEAFPFDRPTLLSEIATTGITPAPATLAVGALRARVVPNPFNPHTTLHYALEAAAPVRVAIYSARGQLLRVVHEGRQEAGEHALRFDGRNAAGQPLGSGVYFYQLNAGEQAARGRLVLAR